MKRLHLRLTAVEHADLVEQAEWLRLRPGQVATRLVQGTLSSVPDANRKLWVELGHTANNLAQLEALVDGAADGGSGAASVWKEKVVALRAAVGALRAEVLGAGESGGASGAGGLGGPALEGP